jgi:hypothetical protein
MEETGKVAPAGGAVMGFVSPANDGPENGGSLPPVHLPSPR